MTHQLKISNKEDLDKWINERRKLNRSIISIKGKPAEGSVYSDGTMIINPINVAWQDAITKEIFKIEYEVPKPRSKLCLIKN